jgi:hypothetical protein
MQLRESWPGLPAFQPPTDGASMHAVVIALAQSFTEKVTDPSRERRCCPSPTPPLPRSASSSFTFLSTGGFFHTRRTPRDSHQYRALTRIFLRVDSGDTHVKSTAPHIHAQSWLVPTETMDDVTLCRTGPRSGEKLRGCVAAAVRAGADKSSAGRKSSQLSVCLPQFCGTATPRRRPIFAECRSGARRLSWCFVWVEAEFGCLSEGADNHWRYSYELGWFRYREQPATIRMIACIQACTMSTCSEKRTAVQPVLDCHQCRWPLMTRRRNSTPRLAKQTESQNHQPVSFGQAIFPNLDVVLFDSYVTPSGRSGDPIYSFVAFLLFSARHNGRPEEARSPGPETWRPHPERF